MSYTVSGGDLVVAIVVVVWWWCGNGGGWSHRSVGVVVTNHDGDCDGSGADPAVVTVV